MYTRRGDAGETSLYGSRRVGKESTRVEAYGTVDELNSAIGLAASDCDDAKLAVALKAVQRSLFVAGADLATDDDDSGRITRISARDTKDLEKMTDELIGELPTLKNFILPGGSRLAAELHLARAVCRRAERRVVAASKAERINPELLPFFNRLSTYLFNAARIANKRAGKREDPWTG